MGHANQWAWMAKPFQSIGGRNMYRINLEALYAEQRPNWSTHYAQRIIPKIREFRAHTFRWLDNPVPLIQEKTVTDRSQLCWNLEQGGVFRYPYQPLIGRLRMLREESELVSRISGIARRACSAIGYDFGGVDIGLVDSGELYVFEVNARMGVREQTLACYKEAFDKLRTISVQDYRARR
jgi:hypothetical protein